MKIKCAVIDDEPLALRQICSYVKRIDSLELVGSWCDPRRALEELQNNSEVIAIFLDIDMPDITGIEFVEQLQGEHYVIFTTAYSNYAIDGFRLNAIDYLLKPLSFNDFERACNKMIELHMLRSEHLQTHLNNVQIEDDTWGYITIKVDYKATPVKVSDIIYIESVGEYIRLNMQDGSSLTTLFRLKNIESELPSELFTRVHRSYIANLSYIRSYNRVKIELSNDVELPIGDSYRECAIQRVEEFYREG